MTSSLLRRPANRKGWVEPLLNAAVVVVLVVPWAVAFGWTWVDALIDQL
jgi:hypothetical protein